MQKKRDGQTLALDEQGRHGGLEQRNEPGQRDRQALVRDELEPHDGPEQRGVLTFHVRDEREQRGELGRHVHTNGVQESLDVQIVEFRDEGHDARILDIRGELAHDEQEPIEARRNRGVHYGEQERRVYGETGRNEQRSGHRSHGEQERSARRSCGAQARRGARREVLHGARRIGRTQRGRDFAAVVGVRVVGAHDYSDPERILPLKLLLI